MKTRETLCGWTVTDHQWVVTWGGGTRPLEAKWKTRRRARKMKALLSKDTGPKMWREIVARKEV
jgi:hypothetical protein